MVGLRRYEGVMERAVVRVARERTNMQLFFCCACGGVALAG